MPARSDALYGAWLCGTVLGNVGMALHHKLWHTLGGSFNLPHALAYNAAAAPRAMERVAQGLGASSAARAVYELARDNGAPIALRDIGLQADDLDKAAALALQNEYPNPRPLEAAAVRRLLQDAYERRPPE